jgi:hypothetical protein
MSAGPELNHQFARNLGEVVDHFLTVPFCLSGGPSAFAAKPVIKDLYAAARELTNDEPLCYTAARRLLESVPRGGRVIIGTGFIVPPYLRLEGDGPMGAPFLARALALTHDVHPIIVTEPANIAAMETMMRASGLQVAPLEEALEIPHKVAVVPFPVDADEPSRKFALDMLEEIAPHAIITIEKPSRNRDGKYHNGMAVEVTATSAKLDFLLSEAMAQGILTIGMGDGGNEMGMGNILPVVERIIPNGKLVGAATTADVLVVAASASWGSYGVEACLAALTGQHQALHDEEMERRMLDASVAAGIVDPLTGTSDGWLDGVPPQVSYAIVRILNYLYEVRARPWALEKYRGWAERKAESDRLIAKHAPRLAAGD